MSVVYVDRLFQAVSRDPQACRVGKRNGHLWCHLWSEDVEALHRLARKIGLKRAWFQDRPGFPHYDLTPGRRLLALQHGAVERSLFDWKREKLAQESPERRRQCEHLAGVLNPEREQHGLAPVDPKTLFEVCQQAELELFLSGAK